MSVLSAKYMHDEAAAFEHVEAMLWTDGPVCPHCGVVDSAYKLVGVRTKASKKNPEGKERHGLWKCRECRKQFTVRKGTIFQESHLPLHLWLQAIHLMVSSKKGISSGQLHRVLGITYKSAWFLTYRIRECMRDGSLADFGNDGGIVEVDETFIGKKPGVVKHPKAHGWTNHSARQYVDYQDLEMHTNTVEGFYSIVKLGMKGVYQYFGKQHLHRYAAEFDFHYNNRVANGVDDVQRGEIALRGARGKRLKYPRPH